MLTSPPAHVNPYTAYVRSKRAAAACGNLDAIAYVERRKALESWHEGKKRKAKILHIRRANRGCRLSRAWLWARNLQVKKWEEWRLDENGPGSEEGRIGKVEIGSLGELDGAFEPEEIGVWWSEVDEEMERMGDEEEEEDEEEAERRPPGKTLGIAFIDLAEEEEEDSECTYPPGYESQAINDCEPVMSASGLQKMKHQWDVQLVRDAAVNGWGIHEVQSDFGRKVKVAVVEMRAGRKSPFMRTLTSLRANRERKEGELEKMMWWVK